MRYVNLGPAQYKKGSISSRNGQQERETPAPDSDSEPVIAFPTRNPAINIKDAKKAALEDMKPELGFGHINREPAANASQTSDQVS